MTPNKRVTAVGLFDRLGPARRAMEALREADFSAADIELMTLNSDQSREFATTTSTGAAEGAADSAGSIAEALIGLGRLEEEARYYEQEVHGGRILLTVKAYARYREADEILHCYGAYDLVHQRGLWNIPREDGHPR